MWWNDCQKIAVRTQSIYERTNQVLRMGMARQLLAGVQSQL
jgi:hypothetical protein